MKNSSNQKRFSCQQFLLPKFYKKVGLLLSIVGVGYFFLSGQVFNISSYYGWHILTLGLLIVSLAKESIEDEWIESIRLKSFFLSTIGATLFVLTYDIIIRLDGGSSNVSGLQLICLLLFIYILWFRYELSKTNQNEKRD